MEVHGYTEHGRIEATIDGKRRSVPDEPGNRERRMIAEWEASGNEIPPYVPPPIDLPAYAAQRRWEREQGGTMWNGWPIHTDDRSQGKVLSELAAIDRNERADPDRWKFADGEFRMISNADFAALAVSARDHVRGCFAAEAQILAGIAAGTVTTTAQIDAAFAAI